MAEMTIYKCNITVVFVNTVFSKEDAIFVFKSCICLKNTLHCSC